MAFGIATNVLTCLLAWKTPDVGPATPVNHKTLSLLFRLEGKSSPCVG